MIWDTLCNMETDICEYIYYAKLIHLAEGTNLKINIKFLTILDTL